MTSKTEGKSAGAAGGANLLVRYDARLRDNVAHSIVEDVTLAVTEAEGLPPPGGAGPKGSAPKAFPRVAIDLATTVERIQQNFCISDPHLPDCPIVYASDSFLELTGYDRHEVLGRNWCGSCLPLCRQGWAGGRGLRSRGRWGWEGGCRGVSPRPPRPSRREVLTPPPSSPRASLPPSALPLLSPPRAAASCRGRTRTARRWPRSGMRCATAGR